MPVVQVERMTSVDTHGVTGDNFGGAYAAVEHLIELGHRRIAFIGVDPVAIGSRRGSAAHPDIEQDRLSGYTHALRDHHLAFNNDLVGLGENYTSGSCAQHNLGYKSMLRFLDLVDPPSAVFATFDLFAAGALQALHSCGLRVPADVSIVGFDDTYAQYFAPPLTSVKHPMVEMGHAAASIVFQILDQPDVTPIPQIVRLPMTLQVRGSTAPPGMDTVVDRTVLSAAASNTAAHVGAAED